MVEGRVVVGAEAAAGSLAALAWALSECRRRGAELVLVHAVEGRAGEGAAAVQDLERHRDEAARSAPDVAVSTVLVDGPAGEALVAAAARADLVVLGSRGRRDVAASALGSVAHRTAVHAHCPVVIVREGFAPVPPGHRGRVVVGLADAPAGRAALRFAAEQAAGAGAVLELVHSVADSAGGDGDAYVAAVRAELVRRHPELPVEGGVVHAEPVGALLDAAADADLVVIGCHHSRDPWASRVGGVAAGVLARAACPVVLVGAIPAAVAG